MTTNSADATPRAGAIEELIAEAWTAAQEVLQSDGTDRANLTDCERALAEQVIALCEMERQREPAPLPGHAEWSQALTAVDGLVQIGIEHCAPELVEEYERLADIALDRLPALPALVADAERIGRVLDSVVHEQVVLACKRADESYDDVRQVLAAHRARAEERVIERGVARAVRRAALAAPAGGDAGGGTGR